MTTTKVTAEIPDGDAKHLFAAYCAVRNVSADELASQLIAERLEQLAADPGVADNLRQLRRADSVLRAVR
jgi:hypothetical protein